MCVFGQVVPPCLCLCAACYMKDSSLFVDAAVQPGDVEEISVTLGDCEDPVNLASLPLCLSLLPPPPPPSLSLTLSLFL